MQSRGTPQAAPAPTSAGCVVSHVVGHAAQAHHAQEAAAEGPQPAAAHHHGVRLLLRRILGDGAADVAGCGAGAREWAASVGVARPAAWLERRGRPPPRLSVVCACACVT